MHHQNINGFELCAFVGDDSDNAFAMILTPKDGEPFMLSMPRLLAGHIAARLSEAIVLLAREGMPTIVPAAPERILAAQAEAMPTDQGPMVALAVRGDRSPVFLGVLPPQRARELAAQLEAATRPDHRMN